MLTIRFCQSSTIEQGDLRLQIYLFFDVGIASPTIAVSQTERKHDLREETPSQVFELLLALMLLYN